MSENNILEKLGFNQSKIQEMLNKEERRLGQLEQLKKDLLKEFGVSDLNAAEAKLKEITKSIDSDEVKLEKLNNEMAEIISKAEGEDNVGSV